MKNQVNGDVSGQVPEIFKGVGPQEISISSVNEVFSKLENRLGMILNKNIKHMRFS